MGFYKNNLRKQRKLTEQKVLGLALIFLNLLMLPTAGSMTDMTAPVLFIPIGIAMVMSKKVWII